MRIDLVVHAVWATWRRMPLIERAFEEQLHATIRAKCCQLRCEPIAIGGVEDHVHLLLRVHPSVPVAIVIGQAKGISSYVANA